ncbi:MAG: zinc-dependent alcohol dehydrogenase family protein [Pseudolabrys sp.]
MKAYEVRETTGLDGLVLNRARPVEAPGPGQIVVRMRACALNYRDQGAIRGIYGYTKFPVIPLSDGAGEVAAVGAGVSRFKVGDRVASTFFQTWPGGRMPADVSRHSLGGMIDGVLCEYAVLSENGAIHIPDALSFEQAATLPCAAVTAWNAIVETGKVRAGESVLVLGTGGVACFALAFARMHGAFVISTSSSDEKLARTRAMGADATVNYTLYPEWQEEVLKLTGGAGVDHVLEVGGAGTLERSMAAVRPGGSIYVIGALAGPGSINPRMINRKAIKLQGIHVGSRDMFAAMNRAIVQSGFQPVIDRVFPFEDAKAAYAHQQSGNHFGKIVIAGAS